jgi:putative salt-induced outer membrane protein YdiY
MTTGNTETRSASATADGTYRREKDRTILGAFWSYQDDDTGVTQRSTGAKAQYDYFFSEKTYGLAQIRAESDYQADLDLRLIFGVGIGRQLVENAVHKFSTEAGLSWFDENYGNSPDQSYLAARLAYTWDWNINKDWVFAQNGELYPSLEYAEDVYAKLDSRIKVSLTEKMFAQGQWVMDWDNTPAIGKDRMDNRYLLTLGWSF